MAAVKRIVIVGAGLVGMGTAYGLAKRYPHGVRITLLEKGDQPGLQQSTHNSGVLHAGLYYKPGSLKARLAVEGIRLMVRFCRENDVPHEVCGKLVVAVRPEELDRLDELLRRGQQNGLSGLRKLGPDELRRIEPHATGLAGAHVPEEGIVDYREVCRALADHIRALGHEIVTGARVKRLRREPEGWTIQTARGPFSADLLINCAGLHSDRITELAGEKREVRIVPFRGEYFKLLPGRTFLVRHLIYPVPDPAFPFLGVHFTRLIAGGVEAGPNAVLAFAREGYSLTNVNPLDLWDTLTFTGFWRFLHRYPQMVKTELVQSLSKKRFCRNLQRLVPDVRPEDLAPGGSGVRAQAMTPVGELLQDFHIVQRDRALHVINAPSPGATACLAIGDHIARLIDL